MNVVIGGFFGDSAIGYSVYPPLINQQLRDAGYNITVYNFYLGNDVPLMRALQVQNIIDSKPALVVYKISYRHLSKFENWIDE